MQVLEGENGLVDKSPEGVDVVAVKTVFDLLEQVELTETSLRRLQGKQDKGPKR